MADNKISGELQISSSTLEKMSSSELETFAEEKSKFILEKIELSTQKITDAKKTAVDAANMKSGWFGKTKKKTDVTADAVIATNEAIGEMNELLQECIHFTCLSLSFAQAMSKHMSALIVKGFENRDGEFIKLSSDSEEQAKYIVQQAEAFAKNQLKVEIKQVAQDSKIENLADKISENENRLNEKDNLDSEQSADIAANRKRLDEKDRIDAVQTQRLEELSALLDNKGSIDQKQEEAISSLKSELKEKSLLDNDQSKRIENNEKSIQIIHDFIKQKDILDKKQSAEIMQIKKGSNLLSIIAIIISSVSLVCNIVLYFLK